MNATTAARCTTSTTAPRRLSSCPTLPTRPGRDLLPARLLARLLSPWLDDRLASGVAPTSGRLLAVRAASLTSPAGRAELADAWDQVLTRASEPVAPVDPRARLAREDVRRASGEIAALAAVLRTPSPLAARDVARAQVLLTDGTGPLYTPGSGLRLEVAILVADLTDAR